MHAAYTDVDGSVEAWRRRLVVYLRANRDHIAKELEGSGLVYTHPEATYLTWIDTACVADRVGKSPG